MPWAGSAGSTRAGSARAVFARSAGSTRAGSARATGSARVTGSGRGVRGARSQRWQWRSGVCRTGAHTQRRCAKNAGDGYPPQPVASISWSFTCLLVNSSNTRRCCQDLWMRLDQAASFLVPWWRMSSRTDLQCHWPQGVAWVPRPKDEVSDDQAGTLSGRSGIPGQSTRNRRPAVCASLGCAGGRRALVAGMP
jgi:hypothetical protein